MRRRGAWFDALAAIFCHNEPAVHPSTPLRPLASRRKRCADPRVQNETSIRLARPTPAQSPASLHPNHASALARADMFPADHISRERIAMSSAAISKPPMSRGSRFALTRWKWTAMSEGRMYCLPTEAALAGPPHSSPSRPPGPGAVELPLKSSCTSTSGATASAPAVRAVHLTRPPERRDTRESGARPVPRVERVPRRVECREVDLSPA